MEKAIETLARELLEIERQREGTEGVDQDRKRDLFRELMQALHAEKRELERRRFLRVPAQLQVRFRAGEATITATAVELSLGGLSLRGYLWLLTNQKMRIESLRVGDRVFPLTVPCRVVWRVTEGEDEPCAGLEFVDISDEGRAQLHTIFNALFVNYLEHLATPDAA